MKTLDTRELQERLDKLEAKRDALDNASTAVSQARVDLHAIKAEGEDSDDYEDNLKEATEALSDAKDELTDCEVAFDKSDEEELKELESLRDEISEWKHGVTLIPESDFKEYAEELAADIGAIDPRAGWPLSCIDWDKAADELKSDYSEATYQGTTYLYRS